MATEQPGSVAVLDAPGDLPLADDASPDALEEAAVRAELAREEAGLETLPAEEVPEASELLTLPATVEPTLPTSPEEIRYGVWSVYMDGLIRKDVMAHTQAEAIQTYKNSLGIRRNDLAVDARRIE